MIRTLVLIFRILLIPVGLIITWLMLMKLVRHVFHFPAPAILGQGLDSDIRRKIQPPAQILERSGFRDGMSVLDLGCGSGAYTTHAARAVGVTGQVCALDIQARMLDQLQRKLERAENRDLKNIRLTQGSAYDLPFRDAAFDLVTMITVLPEIPDPARTLEEVKRVLKPGGILAVTEFFPDPDYPLQKTTLKRGTAAGFSNAGTYGSFWTYTVRFRKRGAPAPADTRLTEP